MYIERTEGDLRIDRRGWWVPEAASEVKEGGDERVRDARVVYAAVAVGIEAQDARVSPGGGGSSQEQKVGERVWNCPRRTLYRTRTRTRATLTSHMTRDCGDTECSK
jgi:hypothetical protein